MSDMSVVFLGTSSGGGPLESRNCSSLVCDMLSDQSLWMVDCAEGTTRQFALQPPFLKPPLRLQNVNKIFVTHMHVDHIMGIIPFLRNVLLPPPMDGSSLTDPRRRVELFGPAGLRSFVRQNMKMTFTRTSNGYVVHELLKPEDQITPCDTAPLDSSARMNFAEMNVMHYSELRGLDICASSDGLWREITYGKGRMSAIQVDAGPILHRDPCIGYVFTELQHPARKLVILGDTYDPSAIEPLCCSPSPSLLIHEATDSHISQHADPSGKLSRRTPAAVRERALSKGHSVPEMAGAFAKRIGANALVLNHIGGRFPAPRNPRDFARQKIIGDIERNANRVWASGKRCKVAYDFLRVEVPPVLVANDAVGGPSSSGLAQHHTNQDPNQVVNHGKNSISAVASNHSEIAHVDTTATTVPSTSLHTGIIPMQTDIRSQVQSENSHDWGNKKRRY